MTLKLATLIFAGLAAMTFCAAPAQARTDVVSYSPVSKDGAIAEGKTLIDLRYKGECSTGSMVVHNALRCSNARFFRLDPCFRDPSRKASVLCLYSPWDTRLRRLKVKGKISSKYSASPGTAWAIELATGDRCTLTTGGTRGFDDAKPERIAAYNCTSILLWGLPDRSASDWTIWASERDFTDLPYPSRLEHKVNVKTAWVGAALR